MRSQSDQAAVGCAGQTNPIHRGPTWQLTLLKGSSSNVLVTNTTAQLQKSCGVHGALTGQSFLEDLHNISRHF